jgi:hypothetical protein
LVFAQERERNLREQAKMRADAEEKALARGLPKLSRGKTGNVEQAQRIISVHVAIRGDATATAKFLEDRGGFTRVGLGGGGITKVLREKLATEEDQAVKEVLSLSRDGGHVTLCLSSALPGIDHRGDSPGVVRESEEVLTGVAYVTFRCSDEVMQRLVREGCERQRDGSLVLRCPG